MAKILWLGDAGCHTGFARVTHNIGERLVSDYGHDVSVLAVNYRGDYWPTNLKLYLPTLKNSRDIYGLSRIVEVLAEVEPDVVVLLNDPQVAIKMLFENTWDTEKILLQYRPLLFYGPIDGYNQPPVWKTLTKVTEWLAFCEFATEYLGERTVVHHGIDTSIYHPVSSDRPITLSNGTVVTSKQECKEAFGYEKDKFLVLRVDRNSYRKNFPDTILALWPVMKRHQNVIAHFHCQPNDPAGYNLPMMLTREPELKDRFYFPGSQNTFEGWPEQDLAALYNASDLFVSTTWGEGFGLTLLEAVATGLPVLSQAVSSIPEVVGPGGVLLDPLRPITVPSGEDQWLPNVPAFEAEIEHLYMSRGARRQLSKAGAEHARKFSWDVAAKKFDESIAKLIKEAGQGEP